MKSNENAVVYNTEETARELNKVRGFNPMKYTRNTESGAVLDLPYQKLWFRLRHPNGKIRLFIQKISDKVSTVEARVYFDRRDLDPAANYIVSGVDATDKNAVASAQRSAMEKALSDAGFGLQFISANPPTQKIVNDPEKMVVKMPTTETAKNQVKVEETPVEKPQNTVAQPKKTTTEVKPEIKAAIPVTNTVTETPATESQKVEAPEQPEEKTPEVKNDPLLSLVNTIENGAIKVDSKTGEVIEETINEQPVSETVNTTEKTTVETETVSIETTEAPVIEVSPVSYDKDTPVEEICKLMSLEDAMNFVIEGGPFNGWKMETLAKTRPVRTLDMIIEKYPTKNNILTAAATIVRSSMQ